MYTDFSRFSIFIALVWLLLITACGGSGSDSDTQEGNNPPASNTGFKLTTLEFDRDATITPSAMIIDSSVQFKAIGQDIDSNTSDISSNVVWSSNNTNIATVDQTGKVTAIAVGEADIVAVQHIVSDSTDETFTSTVTLRQRVVVKSVNMRITRQDESLVFPNTTLQLNAVSTTDTGSWFNTHNEETWSVSNTDIASITDNGMLSVHRPGTVTVQASFISLTATLDVVIYEPLVISVAETGLNYINVQWTELSNADSYDLLIGSTNFFGLINWELVSRLNEPFYEYPELLPNSHYKFQVSAFKEGQKINSEIVSANTHSNNSAILSGDSIGTAAAVTDPGISVIRTTTPVSIASTIPALKMDSAYLVRASSSARIMSVIMPVENTSDSVTYCSVSLNHLQYLDSDGQSPLRAPAISLLSGSIRHYPGASTLLNGCVIPGAKAYFLMKSFIGNGDSFQEDFLSIAEVHGATLESITRINQAVNIAVIPQSYLVVPPTESNPAQRLIVTVLNNGEDTVMISDHSSDYVLLDQDKLPLYTDSLVRNEGWDGVLNPGESNTLYADINYDGLAQSVEAIIDFDLASTQ